MLTPNQRTRAARAASQMRLAAAAFLAMALAGACAVAPDDSATPGHDIPAVKQSGERYVACVNAQAEKHAANPAGAEDIAVAAHARCYADWDAYRKTTHGAFVAAARTPEERQLAQDKADAHLRQFERETRRAAIDRIVERTLSKK